MVVEGVVAVIQGTRDAGLTVTMIGRRNRMAERKRSTKEFPKKLLSPTEQNRNNINQIRNGSYSRSCQLEHCRVVSRSPPVDAPEFPLQRVGPSTNSGNFEIGVSSLEVHSSQAFMNGRRWIQKSAPHRAPREMENFISSLRKYPSDSSPHTSSDMLQRLLSYTHNKNLTRSSYHTRTVSFPAKIGPSTKRNKKDMDKSTKDNICHTNDGLRNGFITNKSKVGKSFGSDVRNLRYEESLLNISYDYLKCTNVTRKDVDRVTEVRYLNDMTRCIRDTLRQIYDDKPNVCPRIRNRYCKHQKECHGRYTNMNPFQDTNSVEIKTPVILPSTSRATATLPSNDSYKCGIQNKLDCTCDKPLPSGCNITMKSTKRLEEVIQEWEKIIPIYANETVEDKTVRKKMLKDLAEKIIDFNKVNEFKGEINNCLNKLPIWSASNVNDKEKLISMLTDNLLRKLEHLQNKFYDETQNFVPEIPMKIRDDKVKTVDRGKIPNGLLKNLKKISVPPSSGRNDLEVKSNPEFSLDSTKNYESYNDGIINTKSIEPLTSYVSDPKACLDSTKNFGSHNDVIINTKAIEPLTSNISHPRASFDSKKNYNSHNDMIMNTEAMTPLTSNKSDTKASLDSTNYENHNDMLICKKNSTYKKIQPLTSDRSDPTASSNSTKSYDSHNYGIVNKEAIESSGSHKNDPKVSFGSTKNYKSANDVKKENIEQETVDLIKDYTQVSSSYPELEQIVKNLTSKCKNILFKDLDENEIADEIQNEIKLSLQDLSNKTAVKIDIPKDFSNRLLRKENEMSDQRRDVNKYIKNTVDDILEYSSLQFSKNKKKNIKDKIGEVLSMNLNTIQSPKCYEVKDKIKQILLEEGINKAEAEYLANTFIEKTQRLNVAQNQNKSLFSPLQKISGFINDGANDHEQNLGISFYSPLEREVKESITNAVKDVLKDISTNISSEQNNKISEKLNFIIKDHIMRGKDDKKTMEILESFLRNENLSSKDIGNISNRLIESAKNISLSISPKRLTMKELAGESILSYLEDLTGDENYKQRDERKAITQRLMTKLNKILDDPSMSYWTKEKLVKDEIDQCLHKLALDTDTPREMLAAKLIDQIKEYAFKSSTPRGSIDKNYSFLANDINTPSSIIIEESSNPFTEVASQKDNQSTNYLKKITEIMQEWVSDVLDSVDKNLKNSIVDDLVVEIVDRKKYLQINPTVKTSEKEEIEQLKYQIFKSLNKILDENTITSVIHKAIPLMYKINVIPVPELARPLHKLTEDANLESSIGELIQEITKWFKDIPAQVYKTKNENHQQIMIKKLASKVHELRIQQNEMVIEAELEAWLNLMVKDDHNLDLHEIINDLRVKIHLPERSKILEKSNSQLSEKDLVAAVLDWMGQKQMFLRRNSLDKRIQENQVATLVKTIRSTLDPQYNYYNLEDLWINQILEMFKHFPMDLKYKFDKELHLTVAKQLQEYLTSLPLLQDKHTSLVANPFTVKDQEWMKSLPQRSVSASVTKQLENTNKKFIMTMKQMKEQYDVSPSDSHYDKIKEKINEYLDMLQSHRHDNFKIGKVEELLDYFKKKVNGLSHPLSTSTQPSSILSFIKLPNNVQDVLYESVENWFDELLSHKALSGEVKEMLAKNKNDLARKLMIKIGELNMNVEVLRDDFLYENLVHDKVEQLLSSIGITTEIQEKMPVNKLLEKIKDTKRKVESKLAGNVYKHQLRETALQHISNCVNMPIEEKAELDYLVDNIADNFINLHYIADNNETRKKYKDKLNKEIKNFCDKRMINGVTDMKQFNKNLYNAMKRVSIPADDSMRLEVNELKIKDTITKLVNELPLNAETHEKQGEVKKLINSLAKTLKELEEEIDINPDSDFDKLVENEITRFIRKLRKVGIEIQNYFTKKLADEIKNSRSQRKNNVTRHSVDFDEPYNQTETSGLALLKPISHVPKSTLSAEDKALFNEVKRRNLPTNIQKLTFRDAGVNTLPTDVSTQTDSISKFQNNESYENTNESPENSMQLKSRGLETGQENNCKVKNSSSIKTACSSTKSKHDKSTLPIEVQSDFKNIPSTNNNSSRFQTDQCSPYATNCSPLRYPCPNVTRRYPMIPSCQIVNKKPCSAALRRPPCRQSCFIRASGVPACPSPKCISIYSSRRPPSHRDCVTRISCLAKKNPSNNLRLQMRKSKEKMLDSDWTDSDYCTSFSRHLESQSNREYSELEERENEKTYGCTQNDQNVCSRQDRYSRNISSSIKEPIYKCSRCWGAHCPYPSCLYFKS